MNIITKAIHSLLSKKPFFHYDLEYELSYINELESRFSSTSDINRSYCQYKCFRKIDNPFKHMSMCIFATLTNPVLILILLLKGCINKNENIKKSKATAISTAMEHTVTEALKEEFDITNFKNKHKQLRLQDLKWIGLLYIKHAFSSYFIQKCILDLSNYRFMMDRYQPDAIIVNREFWFTSSFLTAFLEDHGIQHINVMHGEKFLWFRDSFWRFSTCIVWDIHYQQTFMQLKVPSAQFVIDTPLFIQPKPPEFENTCDPIVAKYYLQGQDNIEVLKVVSTTLDNLGIKFVCRSHPRYTLESDLIHLQPITIEDPIHVPIDHSLEEASFVISKYSTVLLEANRRGKRIILDDLSNVSLHNSLRERRYILATKEHTTLSEWIKNVEA